MVITIKNVRLPNLRNLVIAAVAIGFAVFVYLDKAQSRDKLAAGLQNYNGVLADYLWSLNSRGAHDFLASIIGGSSFLSLTVVDEDGAIFAEAQNDIRLAPPSQLLRLLGLIYTESVTVDIHPVAKGSTDQTKGSAPVAVGRSPNMTKIAPTVKAGTVEATHLNLTIHRYLVALLLIIFLGYILNLTVSYNALFSNIMGTTDDLAEKAETLHREAQHMKASSDQIYGNSIDQSTNLADTVASINQFLEIARSNIENSKKSNSLSMQSIQEAERGATNVSRVNTAMGRITQSNEQVIGFSALIEQIAKETNVISNIAFETKILSFNASIESARAGDHGRGFSIVSDEVARLADATMRASKQVGEILRQSRDAARKITEDALHTVEEGNEALENFKQAFESINSSISEVGKNTTIISEKSSAQVDRISNIRSALNTIERSTKENTSRVEQAQSISETVLTVGEDVNSAIRSIHDTLNREQSFLSRITSRISFQRRAS